MSIFGKKKFEPVHEEPIAEIPEPVEETAEPEPEEEPEDLQVPANLTVISAGTVFVGDIETNDRLEISGTVKGNVRAASEVNVTGTGFVYGNMVAEEIIVDGLVQGEVHCSGCTSITDRGTIKGTLITAFLSTARGASIDGRILLGTAASETQPPAEVPAEVTEAAAAEVPAQNTAEVSEEVPVAEPPLDEFSAGDLPEAVTVDDLFK